MGGTQTWLCAPPYVSSNKPAPKRSYPFQRPSNQPFSGGSRLAHNQREFFGSQQHPRQHHSQQPRIKKEPKGKSEDFPRKAGFRDRWEELGAPPYILRLISGTRIPLVSRPPLFGNWQQSRFITRFSPEMSKQIDLLKLQRVLEPPKREGPSFISRIFLVTKSNGDPCPIFDLRGLNIHVQTQKFRLISHHQIPEFLQNGDFMTRIDIFQAYFHVPIAESHRQLLRLVYNGELLQMTSLPFSLSSAPHTFAMISNWVAETIRSLGVRLIVYLDDFLLACQNRSKLMVPTEETVKLLTHLGWVVNLEKCDLTPNQRMDFLGFTWDSKQN
ncbi:uncharacterized protein LOC135162242 [Diachasmimorpha longicaudata]|uniref:uncharacterized protein LOC135162242 n=1 Tax=Diachasmimorpha longicaudata TaxID=58733 RepID=UPI0030B8E13A